MARERPVESVLTPGWPANGSWTLGFALAGLAALTAWLFYPGLMSFDSLYQYRQVIGELPVRNYHPPVTVYLWRAGHTVLGPGALLLFQQALYWSGIGLIAAALTGRTLPRLVVALAIGLLPPLWVHSATIWNDSGVTTAWLFGLGCTLSLARGAPRWLGIPAVLAIAYGALAKEHALFAALPLLALLAGSLRRSTRDDTPPLPRARWRTALAALVAWLVLAGAGQALSHIGVERMTKWTTVAVWDLAAVSLEENRLLLPRSALNYPYESEPAALLRLSAAFRPEVNGTLVTAADLFPRGGNEQELWSAWLALPRSHPGAYVAHRSRVLLGLLGLGPVTINLPYQGATNPNDLGVELVNEGSTALDTARAGLRWAAAGPLFRPWLYLALLLGATAYVMVRRRPARSLADSLPPWLAASGVLYLAPLWLVAPATDFRYALWTVACGAVAACAAACALLETNSRNGERSVTGPTQEEAAGDEEHTS